VPGLLQFLRSGGKAIVWHGADDALLSHKDTIRTWRQVTDALGPKSAAAATRLYIAPGVNHCSGGDGADSFDALGALMEWVETGRAPGTLTAVKRDAKSGEVKFSRPLCQYPAWPRYRGKGDPASADSFECVAPGG
jgi:feruloyl esterase